MPPAASNRRGGGGGIRKHQQQRRDRDGDLVMGATPRAATARQPAKPQTSNASRNLTELRVTGWTDDSEIQKVTKFLERHASKRSMGTKTGGIPPAMIKRSRVTGDTLIISVRPEDVPAFSKINGFSFASSHGNQKMVITGPGIRQKSPIDTTGLSSGEAQGTVELLEGFLERRYDVSQKLLNLSSIADDEKVSASGMFNTHTTQAKFFPALMVIVDRQLKSVDQKREAIHSVTLSNNST